MMHFGEGESIDCIPCVCGFRDIVARPDKLTTTTIIMTCDRCGLSARACWESARSLVEGTGYPTLYAYAYLWGRAVSDEDKRRTFARRSYQSPVTSVRITPTPTTQRPTPPDPARATAQPFGVRHNLPPPKPPKPPEPPPPEPIKEIPREYDRYELLELDKNTSQKELTFEGCWFTYIELN